MKYENTPWLYPGWEISFSPEELMSIDEVVEIIVNSVKTRTPLSLVRVGDGELTVMSQNICLSSEYLSNHIAWKTTDYCGVSLREDMLDQYKTRDRLIESVKTADLVGVYPRGIFTSKVFSAIHFKPSRLFFIFSNLNLCTRKSFVDLIIESPPLLVGRLSEQFAGYIKETLGVQVPGYYTGQYGPNDIEKTIEFMASIPHDWSLVSSGVNADLIAPIMAKQYGKVCVDYGQGVNVLLDPKYKGKYKFYGH